MLNGKRTYSGCVATAMAQVLNWHKYPARATGTKTYTWENGATYDTDIDYAELESGWGWKGMNLFYYTLPTVPDGV